ncbi:hypothetical protein [Aquimarina sp. AU474]|uniref:hypothetical protein n=1 Tax=Aquimarina sp. AU474 TaxID=2108529 RepID=UPI000D69F64A|nr:hypothetical protein [Aquimarina sp. AU474]
MKTIIINISIFLFTIISFAQPKVPDWFIKNMEQSIGTWVTSNDMYKNKNEPFDAYEMQWEWGVGKQSITGKLYGLIANKRQGFFWEFRQYWDVKKHQGTIVQYGGDGSIGIGPLVMKKDQFFELIQEFVSPKGEKTTHGHRSSFKKGKLTTTSYGISTNGKWTENRTYEWSNIKND